MIFNKNNFFTTVLMFCIVALLNGCGGMGMGMVDDPDHEGYFTLTKTQHETHPKKSTWACVKATSGREICGMGCKASRHGVQCAGDSTERR